MSERERWDFLRALAPESAAAADDFTSCMARLVDEAGHDTSDAFLALLDQASRVAEADRAAAWERIRHDADAIAEELTETMLPADLRAAGMRITWAASSRSST